MRYFIGIGFFATIIIITSCKKTDEISIYTKNEKLVIANKTSQNLDYKNSLFEYAGDAYIAKSKTEVVSGFLIYLVDDREEKYLTCGTSNPALGAGIFETKQLKENSEIAFDLPNIKYYAMCNNFGAEIYWQIQYITTNKRGEIRLDQTQDYKILWQSNKIRTQNQYITDVDNVYADSKIQIKREGVH